MRHFLLLIIASLTFAGDVPVNPVIKSALDSYETDVAKAYAEYLKAVNKVNEKTVKDLDVKFKAAMKKGDLDLANAIKKQVEEINSGETLADLETKWKEELVKGLLDGPADLLVLVGKWGNGSEVIWEFKENGVGQHFWGGVTHGVTWVKSKTGYIITVQGYRERPVTFTDKNTIQVEPGQFVRMK